MRSFGELLDQWSREIGPRRALTAFNAPQIKRKQRLAAPIVAANYSVERQTITDPKERTRLSGKLLTPGNKAETEGRRDGETERFMFTIPLSLCRSVSLSVFNKVASDFRPRPINHCRVPKNVPPIERTIEAAHDGLRPICVG